MSSSRDPGHFLVSPRAQNDFLVVEGKRLSGTADAARSALAALATGESRALHVDSNRNPWAVGARAGSQGASARPNKAAIANPKAMSSATDRTIVKEDRAQKGSAAHKRRSGA